MSPAGFRLSRTKFPHHDATRLSQTEDSLSIRCQGDITRVGIVDARLATPIELSNHLTRRQVPQSEGVTIVGHDRGFQIGAKDTAYDSGFEIFSGEMSSGPGSISNDSRNKKILRMLAIKTAAAPNDHQRLDRKTSDNLLVADGERPVGF